MEQFLQLHEPQLRASGVPEHLWQTVHEKLKNQTFDAGDKLSVVLIEYGEDDDRDELDPVWAACVSAAGGIQANDVSAVYLVDHAWTYRTDVARQQLTEIPGLLRRMSIMMGVDADKVSTEAAVDQVLARMWRYNCTYSVNADGVAIENQLPVWYIHDELGSAILHSDTPNFRLIPFIHLPDKVTYSLLFPVRNCDEGEMLTRDFIGNVVSSEDDSLRRQALLLPWQRIDFTDEPIEQCEPDPAYFVTGHVVETLPEAGQVAPVVDANRPLRVFSEYALINQYLTDCSFEVVDNERDADVLWYITHFKAFKELSEATPNRFVNQFPFEFVLTVKDLLSVVCRRSVAAAEGAQFDERLQSSPAWLPTTFNLNTELVQFVSYFQRRAAAGLDNHWIVKPWNLARGLDIHITSSLNHILRLPATGPKIAQKYVHRPVLFERTDVAGGPVKFDVRYVILLKRVQPMEAFVYRHFFLRFANKDFALDHFEDYEKHFTVMNYTEGVELKHLPCKEFLDQWRLQFPDHDWIADVESKICQMLREILDNAVKSAPPTGIAPNTQSRALYAADIMLEWNDAATEIQPKILEINWMPDCARACQYYPDFYNDIFKLLFLDEVNVDQFREL